MVQNMLNVGIDVMDIHITQSETVIPKITKKIQEVTTVAINTTSQNIFATAKQALAALNWLLKQYKINPLQPDPIIIEPDDEEENEPDGQGDSVDEETNDNLDPSKSKQQNQVNSLLIKAYTRPKTVNGREKQKALRNKVRQVWSAKSEKLKTSKEELWDAMNGYYEIDEDLLDEFTRFVNSNRQNDGAKLSQLYEMLDELIDDYDG